MSFKDVDFQSTNKIISIFGPTASGKTAIATKLSEYFPIEIINVDSIQVYKYLNIGSAKPILTPQDTLKYHLIDFLEPDVSYNAYDFFEDCKKIVEQIIIRHNIPVLVGGSPFYFASLFQSIPSSPKSEENIREQVEQIYNKHGLSYLYDILVSKYGYETVSKTIHKNNTHRIKRAFEIHLQSGKFVSEFGLKAPDFPYKSLNIFLNFDRNTLYQNIDKRVDLMMEMGLKNEIYSLISMGYGKDTEALRKGIGYKEFFSYGDIEDNLDMIIDNIKLDSRHYAKRQVTFFKKIPHVEFSPFDKQLFYTISSFLT